jgi:hypothetical protein
MPPEPNENVHSAIAGALAATQNAPESVQAAAVSAAAGAASGQIPAPDSKTTQLLWLILVTVLGAVVLASAIAAVAYILANKASPPDLLITIFTTAFSGLIGLFVKPPST